MRIPITMCHGVSETLSIERFKEYFRIASEMGFYAIDYNDLANWRAHKAELPRHPIMFDFDHPVRSIYNQILPVMNKFGFKGNLFINTDPMEEMYADDSLDSPTRQYMSWSEIKTLLANGWQIGAHTHTHPNLSELSVDDPSGEAIRSEMSRNDDILLKELGIQPKEFAFTGTSWSSLAEQEARKRYRFGRLWIIGSMYQADGKPIRYADLVGVSGADEPDGGPPYAARYITEDTDSYKIPSMELEKLIYDYDDFRFYLAKALAA